VDSFGGDGEKKGKKYNLENLQKSLMKEHVSSN
jgi:hypothetical protein